MTTRTERLQDDYLRREGHEAGKFKYFWPSGERYTDKAGIERIAALAVPPAYTDVYVSPDAEAELQAFGRDAAGRLQYRYHPDYVEARALNKWRRMARFAQSLSLLRELTTADLRAQGLPPRKVMAVMTRLLHMAHFRVGSDRYARQHKTYGLTTLRKKHVSVSGGTVQFDFKGKHGVQQSRAVVDRTIAANIERLLELPGYHVFQTDGSGEGGGGEKRRIKAAELNAYLKEQIGPFTAKDFRTWGGTLLAAEYLAEFGAPESEKQAKSVLVECVKVVAEDLGNTPAVTRGSYICPVIFERYLEGQVLDDFEPRAGRLPAKLEGLTRSEAALARMLAAEPHLATPKSASKRKKK